MKKIIENLKNIKKQMGNIEDNLKEKEKLKTILNTLSKELQDLDNFIKNN